MALNDNTATDNAVEGWPFIVPLFLTLLILAVLYWLLRRYNIVSGQEESPGDSEPDDPYYGNYTYSTPPPNNEEMKYFTVNELTRSATASRYGIDNTPTQGITDNLKALVYHVLDPLREAYGKPIIVNSGYRCPELNRKVGGSSTSQHLLGQAADIQASQNGDNARLFTLAVTLGLPYDQLIWEHNGQWIHVSYGPRHRRQKLALPSGTLPA